MSGHDIPPDREGLFRDAVAFLRDVKVSCPRYGRQAEKANTTVV